MALRGVENNGSLRLLPRISPGPSPAPEGEAGFSPMPRTTHCPDCRHTFRVPDFMVHRQVKCPACTKSFTAEADPDAPSGSKLDLPAVAVPAGEAAGQGNGIS